MKFLDKISKNIQMSNFIELLPVGTEFFHGDRRTDVRTDMTNLIVAFRNFAKAPTTLFSPQFYNTNISTEGHGKWGSTHVSYLGSAGFVSPQGYWLP
jgi:hypothetical protein